MRTWSDVRSATKRPRRVVEALPNAALQCSRIEIGSASANHHRRPLHAHLSLRAVAISGELTHG
jgi:hypothetical protein